MGKIILLSLLLATTAQAQQFKITFNKAGFKDALPQLCINNSEATNLNTFFSQNYTALQWCQVQTINQATQAGAIPDAVGKLISLNLLKITSQNITALPSNTSNFSNLSINIENSNLSGGLTSLLNIDKIKALDLVNDNLYNTDLNNLKNITQITNGSIYLNKNNLTNTNGLQSLKTISNGMLNLTNNNIIDDTGLYNLNYVSGVVAISYNPITNVNGLQNLTYAYNIQLSFDPNLEDLSGLSHVVVKTGIYLDNRSYTTKIPSSAPICAQNLPAYTFDSSGNTITLAKSNYCN